MIFFSLQTRTPLVILAVFYNQQNYKVLLFVLSSTPTTPRERNFLPAIEVGRPGEDGAEEDPYSWRRNEYYRSMTSLVLEKSNKNSQTWVSVCLLAYVFII